MLLGHKGAQAPDLNIHTHTHTHTNTHSHTHTHTHTHVAGGQRGEGGPFRPTTFLIEGFA